MLNVSGSNTADAAEYARVAQLVEHDLAKVGAAGSSPVSRFLYKRRYPIGYLLFHKRFLPDLTGSKSSLRFMLSPALISKRTFHIIKLIFTTGGDYGDVQYRDL